MDQKIEYSRELANKICHLITTGKSLRSICSLPDMPSKTSISNWLKAYPYFADNYAIAQNQSSNDKSVLKKADEIEKKRSTGRPSKYSKEMGIKICDHIAEGRTLSDIENLGSDWPSKKTINRWLSHKSYFQHEFSMMYEKSKLLRADLYEDKLMSMLGEHRLDANDEKGIKRAQDIRILQWLITDSRSKSIDLSSDDSNEGIDMSKILEDDEQGNALEILEKIAMAQAKSAK